MHLRVSSADRANGLTVSRALVVLVAAWALGCGARDAVVSSWTLEPSSPAPHQKTRAVLTLEDEQGRPIAAARLRFEAHMSHPGMAPVVVDATERDAGVYEAELTFTMAGPWTLVADASLPDGRRITRTLEIPDVR